MWTGATVSTYWDRFKSPLIQAISWACDYSRVIYLSRRDGGCFSLASSLCTAGMTDRCLPYQCEKLCSSIMCSLCWTILGCSSYSTAFHCSAFRSSVWHTTLTRTLSSRMYAHQIAVDISVLIIFYWKKADSRFSSNNAWAKSIEKAAPIEMWCLSMTLPFLSTLDNTGYWQLRRLRALHHSDRQKGQQHFPFSCSRCSNFNTSTEMSCRHITSSMTAVCVLLLSTTPNHVLPKVLINTALKNTVNSWHGKDSSGFQIYLNVMCITHTVERRLQRKGGGIMRFPWRWK